MSLSPESLFDFVLLPKVQSWPATLDGREQHVGTEELDLLRVARLQEVQDSVGCLWLVCKLVQPLPRRLLLRWCSPRTVAS